MGILKECSTIMRRDNIMRKTSGVVLCALSDYRTKSLQGGRLCRHSPVVHGTMCFALPLHGGSIVERCDLTVIVLRIPECG